MGRGRAPAPAPDRADPSPSFALVLAGAAQETMCAEFGQIFELCLFIMENSDRDRLLLATLEVRPWCGWRGLTRGPPRLGPSTDAAPPAARARRCGSSSTGSRSATSSSTTLCRCSSSRLGRGLGATATGSRGGRLAVSERAGLPQRGAAVPDGDCGPAAARDAGPADGAVPRDNDGAGADAAARHGHAGGIPPGLGRAAAVCAEPRALPGHLPARALRPRRGARHAGHAGPGAALPVAGGRGR